MMKVDRNINKLSNNFKLKVINFLKEVWDEIFITEWFRTKERQQELYAQWRTTAGSKVTWTLKSNHLKWIAIDIAFKWGILYPKNHNKWKRIWRIANKYWMDWGYDLWGKDKSHFQDNWKTYKQNTMEKYGKNITSKGLKYPASIYGIPIRLKKTDSDTLLGYSSIKWYAPKSKRDEIFIFENSFKIGETYLYKIINHESQHFLYHKYYTKAQKIFVEWLFQISKVGLFPSGYSKTSVFEFCSEIVWYGETYIKDNIELPENKKWTKWTQFIYEILKKFNKSALKKHYKK